MAFSVQPSRNIARRLRTFILGVGLPFKKPVTKRASKAAPTTVTDHPVLGGSNTIASAGQTVTTKKSATADTQGVSDDRRAGGPNPPTRPTPSLIDGQPTLTRARPRLGLGRAPPNKRREVAQPRPFALVVTTRPLVSAILIDPLIVPRLRTEVDGKPAARRTKEDPKVTKSRSQNHKAVASPNPVEAPTPMVFITGLLLRSRPP